MFAERFERLRERVLCSEPGMHGYHEEPVRGAGVKRLWERGLPSRDTVHFQHVCAAGVQRLWKQAL